MYEHSDLVHNSFPSPMGETRVTPLSSGQDAQIGVMDMMRQSSPKGQREDKYSPNQDIQNPLPRN